jgi:membrane protein
MPGIKERVTGAVAAARERVPVLDHVIRTVMLYSRVNGSLYSAGVTYAAFLSFFPLLALAFAVVGVISRILPPGADAQQTLVHALTSVFPGIVGGDHGIPLSTFRSSAPAILSIGLPLALWSGLGWLSNLRTALLVLFEEPADHQPNWFAGQWRDLKALVVLGLTLMLSVAVSGVVSVMAGQLLDLVGLAELAWVVKVLVPLIGLAANVVLFYAMYVLLARPQLSRKALMSGAILGAVGFEILKQASVYLLHSTQSQPAFQAFGIALILLLWINYFSQLVLYTAAWARTSDK